MTMDIAEADWKILRSLKPVALDRYCAGVLQECATLIQDGGGSHHERYLRLFELVRERDRTLSTAFDGLRRSTALFQLAVMHRLGLLTADEFDRFSTGTREAVLRMSRPAR